MTYIEPVKLFKVNFLSDKALIVNRQKPALYLFYTQMFSWF